jgi:hypothetical protein
MLSVIFALQFMDHTLFDCGASKEKLRDIYIEQLQSDSILRDADR